MRAFLLSAVLVLPPPATAPALHAQAEERAVMTVVQQLFDGMRARDTARMRATLHPDARLVSAGVKDSVPTVTVVAVTDWLPGPPPAPPGGPAARGVPQPSAHGGGGRGPAGAG